MVDHSNIIRFDQLKVLKKFETLADRLEWDAVKPGQEFNSPAFGNMRFDRIDKQKQRIIMIDQDGISRSFDLNGRISKNGNCMIQYRADFVYEVVPPPRKLVSNYDENFSSQKSDATKYACSLLYTLKKANKEIDSFYNRFIETNPRISIEGIYIYIQLALKGIASLLHVQLQCFSKRESVLPRYSSSTH